MPSSRAPMSARRALTRPNLHHRSRRRLPLPESAAGPLQNHRDALRLSTAVRDVIVAVGRSVELPLALKMAPCRRNDHRHRRVADHRHARPPARRPTSRPTSSTKIPTSRDPFALMRSVPGVLRRSRQHRRQRDRPAVELRVEGHAAAGRGVDDGRHRHHRHGRRPARRRPTSTTTTSRRSRSSTAGQDIKQPTGGVGPQPRRQARHQPVPRRLPRLLRQRRDGIGERAGRTAPRPA